MSDLEIMSSEDSYLVNLASILGGADRTVLVCLYQPLCGYGAISLYFNLWAQAEHYRKGSAFGVDNLLKSMNVTLEELHRFRSKLEGIGLLKTYLNEELRVYKYELYAPLAPKDFFTHELLGTLFKEIMPKKSYDKIKSSFEIELNDDGNYVDISSKFNDVYNVNFDDISTLKDVISSGNNLVDKTTKEIESNFSLAIFLAALNEKKINKSLIGNNFIELLKSMASLYSLDECELCEIVSTCIEGYGNNAKINFETFRNRCYSYKKIPVIDKKDAKKVTDKRLGMARKAEMFKELEPFEFLKIKQNNQDASFQDIKLIEDLVYISKLNPEVINVLIDYVMIKQDNKLIYNYVMKIANTLSNMGIKTCEEAMEYFSKIQNSYSSKNNQQSKVQASEVITKTETPVKQVKNTQTDLEEELEFERLKEERRKRKKENAATQY